MKTRIWGLFVALAMVGVTSLASAEQAQRLSPGEVLRGKFVQERVLQGFSAPLRTTGQFVLAPEQGLIWRAEHPFTVTTIMTAQGIAQQNGDVQMLNIPASKMPALAQLYGILNGALVGDAGMLQEHFEVVENQGGTGWSMILTPRAGASASTITQIRIDGSRFVDKVVIIKDGGDEDRLSFQDQSLEGGPLSEVEIGLLARLGQ